MGGYTLADRNRPHLVPPPRMYCKPIRSVFYNPYEIDLVVTTGLTTRCAPDSSSRPRPFHSHETGN